MADPRERSQEIPRYPHLITAARGVPDGWPYPYGFAGACYWSGFSTFSVGVFAVVPMRRAGKLKRGKVFKRFRGYVSNPDAVYEAAEQCIALLEVRR